MIVLKVLSLILAFSLLCYANEIWRRPGCHRVGHTRKISIPDCVEFDITTNVCRGFCTSYAVPSMPWVNTRGDFKPPVVSMGTCCSMEETEEVHARVQCLDGIRNFTLHSAVSCSCYICKYD